MPDTNDFVEVVDKHTKQKSRVPRHFLELFDHLELRERAPKTPAAPTKASKATDQNKE